MDAFVSDIVRVQNLGGSLKNSTTVQAGTVFHVKQGDGVLVLLGVRPDTHVAEQVIDLLREAGKPAVVALLGFDAEGAGQLGLTPARTFQEAALLAVSLVKGDPKQAVQQFLELENQGLHGQGVALRQRLLGVRRP